MFLFLQNRPFVPPGNSYNNIESKQDKIQKGGYIVGISNTNKTLSKDNIKCNETFKIQLSLTGEPDIVSNPTDIVLILDRSGSMAGSPLANLKNGANKFIDIIDEATDSTQDGQIGHGSHIGIVSFANTATQDTQLITSVTDLKAAVNNLTADGLTNHADAFTKAYQLFDSSSTNAKVIVMFTDGKTTAGQPPAPIAQAIKAQNVIIYCIGLSGNGGIDQQALKDWASDPDSAYVAITPNDEELEDLFEDLAKNIAKPGGTNIILTDHVLPCFKIISVSSPTKGTATLIDNTTVQWKIDELGVSQSEGAILEFTVEHTGSCNGLVEVNESISYEDDQNNTVNFPSPKINVDCGTTICAETCPEPIEITVDGCEDAITFDAGKIAITSLGRIVELKVTLPNVCPHRRIALAVILTEVDKKGCEYQRGLKTMTIPAHDHDTCRDITIRCIRFVLPEDLNVSSHTNTLCSKRELKARFIAHYIDNDFKCQDLII